MLTPTHLFLVTAAPTPPGDPVSPDMPVLPHRVGVTVFSLPEDDACLDDDGDLADMPRLEAHAQALLDGNSPLPWEATRCHVLRSLDSFYARPHSRWGIRWATVAQALSGVGEWEEYMRVLHMVADWSARMVRRPGFDFSDPRDAHVVWLARSLADNGVDDRNFVGLGAYGVRDRVLWSHAEVATPMCSPAAWWDSWYTARELGLETGK